MFKDVSFRLQVNQFTVGQPFGMITKSTIFSTIHGEAFAWNKEL